LLLKSDGWPFDLTSGFSRYSEVYNSFAGD